MSTSRGRMAGRLLAVLVFTLGVATGALAVEPRFEGEGRGAGPFPSDRLTVPDPGQRTGLRVALPRPDCAVARSACDDVRLLDELDGFDLDPRLAVPFTGPIDPGSVSARSLFLVRLAPGPPEAVGIDRVVYDPATHTLYARPEALLEPETRYGLVVTRELRDGQGQPVRRAAGFGRFLREPPRSAGARVYRDALRRLLGGALAQRGVKAEEVVVASVFTTNSVSAFLEQAREALDRRLPEPAVMGAPDGGGRAWFPRSALKGLVLHRQVRVHLGDAEAFRDDPLPLAALPAEVGGLGVGWFWSPSYLDGDQRIGDTATARRLAEPLRRIPVPFVIIVPAGAAPAGGWPLALMGHGYGGEMFGSALRIAGTLARHGIATAAITVVGHGGGPEGRLLVSRADGETVRIPVPGRGVDLDGDGVIGPTEGLGPRQGGPLALLGLRDGLRQQTVDLMAFVRALRGGLDVDGDGVPDTRGDSVFYVGQSLGGIYGTLLVAVDPRVSAGVLSVPGGPIAEVARLSPVFRPLLRRQLAGRMPPLLNAGDDFREDLPLRGQPPVVDPASGAPALQEYLARAEWLARRGDAVAYARYLRLAPLPGQSRKPVLVQFAWGDSVVPNPTTSALLRAGQLSDATSLLRYDRVVGSLPRELADPHPFLLRVGAPGLAGALARAAQEQVARFFISSGTVIWNPDDASPPPFTERIFEIPAAQLPERAIFTATE